MVAPPIRVVIAGGGVAGLEALSALRALAGERAQLTLVAPEDEFVFTPLDARREFRPTELNRIPLSRIARDVGAAHVESTVLAVDPERKSVSTADDQRFEYNALVLATGAQATPNLKQAMIWDDRSEADMLGGLLRDAEEGYTHSLAVVIPKGPCWPLRAYELALLVALDAKDMGAELHATIVTPEPSPLAILGAHAVDLIASELAKAGVSVVPDDRAVFEDGRLTATLSDSGEPIAVNRVLALPSLRGRPLPGIPTDPDGFVSIDDHCRVVGLADVWAAGDGTAFPLKSGGFASEQADIAAECIAAAAGAAVEPHVFDPSARADLAGLPTGRFLEARVNKDSGRGLTMHLPAFGMPMLTYLERDLRAGYRGSP